MTGFSFWIPTWLLCLGLAVLTIDPWLEPELRDHIAVRLTSSLAFGVVLIGFMSYLLFLPAPLKIQFTGDRGDYSKGEAVGTLTWEMPEHESDFRITIANPTGSDYTDLDLEFRTNMIVWQQGFKNGPPCWFLPASNYENDVRYRDDSGQEHVARNIYQGSRIRCDVFPKHTMLEMIFGVVSESEDKAGEFAPKQLPTRIELRVTYKLHGKPYEQRIGESQIAYEPNGPAAVR
jgi:hypothetical protein